MKSIPETVPVLPKYSKSMVFSAAATLLFSGCRSNEVEYADDPEDPVPYVGKIDVIVSTDQSLRYGLVVATPIGDDSRSLQRLETKCQHYIEDFASPQTQAELATRTPGRKYIEVYLNPSSSAQARAVLDRCGKAAASEGIEFTVSDSLKGP
jgi:hypothetical protein